MLVLTLYSNPAKNDDKACLIPKNISDISQVSYIACDPKKAKTKIYIIPSENTIVLRKKVVARDYGGIEKLVEKVKLGEINLEIRGKLTKV